MITENTYKRAKETAEFLISTIGNKYTPKTAIILGSGLGNFADNLTDTTEIKYEDIINFPVSTVKGHDSKLIFGKIESKDVVILKGRFHFYEGYSMKETTFPIRVLQLLGIDNIILTNAAGGLNSEFNEGDLMIINDHLKLSAFSPLTGANIEEFGVRFPDLLNAYDAEYIDVLKNIAKEENIEVREGVYAFMAGPQFETNAEKKALRILGADAVGMSTVPETIVARHSGIKVVGISCITNVMGKESTHEEVLDVANKQSQRFTKLLIEFIKKI